MISKTLFLFTNRKITKDEYIILQYIEDNPEVSIENIINTFKQVNINIKKMLSTLYTKKLIIILNNKNIDLAHNILENNLTQINIEKENLEVKTNDEAINLDEKENPSVVDKKLITVNEVDQIRLVLNRELKAFELENLKKMYQMYSFENIVSAIQKASLKGIDNFKYIEKILENQQNKMQNESNPQITNKVKKEFNFFD